MKIVRFDNLIIFELIIVLCDRISPRLLELGYTPVRRIADVRPDSRTPKYDVIVTESLGKSVDWNAAPIIRSCVTIRSAPYCGQEWSSTETPQRTFWVGRTVVSTA